MNRPRQGPIHRVVYRSKPATLLINRQSRKIIYQAVDQAINWSLKST